jgi:hypothetical protein
VTLLLAVLAGAGCGERSDTRIARRILDDHRRRARVKPLPGAQVIRLRLSAPAGKDPAEGTALIEWDGLNYRETTASAGWTRARGIQSGKAYLTDEDGVTRVASEPVLSELLTRSYFWRRAYLFDDRENAAIALGPAGDSSVSVRVTPRGGHPLLLTFSRSGELLSASAPRFDLRFHGPRSATDVSKPGAAVELEIRSIALPSGQLADTQVGGWSSRWSGPSAEAPLLRLGRCVAVDGRLGGQPVRIAIDADADGPLRLRAAAARRLSLTPAADVLGRRTARSGPLEIGSLAYPAILVDVSDEVPEGADAFAGAVFFRETVVELDPANARVGFHDPARWSAPAGYFRGLLDDDGDRPVAVLRQENASLRLRAGTAAGPVVLLAPESARRINLADTGARADELRWGTAPIPSSPVAVTQGFDAEWGDDGALGYDILLRFHAFLDMTRRWAYLRPLDGTSASLARDQDLRGVLATPLGGLGARQGNRGVAAGAKQVGADRERLRFHEQHGVAVGADHFHVFRRLVLVRRAPARHSGLGRRFEAQDVLITHRCSSS